MPDHLQTTPSWWDTPVATPRQMILVFIVWTVLDCIEITLKHLL